MPKPLIFTVGDTVKYVGGDNYGGLHLILEISTNTGCIEYSTDRGAWFNHDDFILHRGVTEETLQRAIQMNSIGEEDDDPGMDDDDDDNE